MLRNGLLYTLAFIEHLILLIEKTPAAVAAAVVEKTMSWIISLTLWDRCCYKYHYDLHLVEKETRFRMLMYFIIIPPSTRQM